MLNLYTHLNHIVSGHYNHIFNYRASDALLKMCLHTMPDDKNTDSGSKEYHKERPFQKDGAGRGTYTSYTYTYKKGKRNKNAPRPPRNRRNLDGKHLEDYMFPNYSEDPRVFAKELNPTYWHAFVNRVAAVICTFNNLIIYLAQKFGYGVKPWEHYYISNPNRPNGDAVLNSQFPHLKKAFWIWLYQQPVIYMYEAPRGKQWMLYLRPYSESPIRFSDWTELGYHFLYRGYSHYWFWDIKNFAYGVFIGGELNGVKYDPVTHILNNDTGVLLRTCFRTGIPIDWLDGYMVVVANSHVVQYCVKRGLEWEGMYDVLTNVWLISYYITICGGLLFIVKWILMLYLFRCGITFWAFFLIYHRYTSKISWRRLEAVHFTKPPTH